MSQSLQSQINERRETRPVPGLLTAAAAFGLAHFLPIAVTAVNDVGCVAVQIGVFAAIWKTGEYGYRK